EVQERRRRSGRPREAHGGAVEKGPRPRDWPSRPALLSRRHARRRLAHLLAPIKGGPNPMPTDRDLFAEEQSMVAMSFGDHIEELRARLILGLLGLMVGVVVTFIPPLDIGKRIMTKMQAP